MDDTRRTGFPLLVGIFACALRLLWECIFPPKPDGSWLTERMQTPLFRCQMAADMLLGLPGDLWAWLIDAKASDGRGYRTGREMEEPTDV